MVPYPSPFPWSKSGRQMNPVFSNWFSQFQPSSIRVKLLEAMFADCHKQYFSLLALTSNHDRSASYYKFHAFTIHVHLHTPTSKAYSLILTARGRSKEYLFIPWTTQENLELNPPPHSLDSHQKQKDEILDWCLISNSWNATLLTFHSPGQCYIMLSLTSIPIP